MRSRLARFAADRVRGAVSPVAEPRVTSLVYAPPEPLLPLALHERLAARHLHMSADGRAAAAVVRADGSSLAVTHSDPASSFPPTVFRELTIIQTFPVRGAKVWGEREGVRGVWMLSGSGPRLLAPMRDIRRIVRGPYGDIVVGSDGNDGEVHVVRETPIILPTASALAFDGTHPHPRTLLPVQIDGKTMWFNPSVPRDGMPDDWGGDAVFPLSFVADRATLYMHHGRALVLVRGPQGDAFWLDGRTTLLTPHGTDGGVDQVWTSPTGNALAMLLRVASRDGNVVRRLLVNGSVAYEGSFFMRPDGFRWSPNGEHYVAHLTRTDSDGEQAEEVVLAGRQTMHASPSTVHEPRVDDLGRTSYVVADRHGRRLVVGERSTRAFPYVWNLSQVGDTVAANVLARGNVYRIEVDHAR